MDFLNDSMTYVFIRQYLYLQRSHYRIGCIRVHNDQPQPQVENQPVFFELSAITYIDLLKMFVCGLSRSIQRCYSFVQCVLQFRFLQGSFKESTCIMCKFSFPEPLFKLIQQAVMRIEVGGIKYQAL